VICCAGAVDDVKSIIFILFSPSNHCVLYLLFLYLIYRGLPHTDESFTNKDLGNCMDYTNNPKNNKAPDISNYQFLYELYGLVPGAAPYTPPTEAPSEPSSTSTATTSTAADTAVSLEDEDNVPPNEERKKEKDNKQGRRHRKTRRRVAHDVDEPLADWLQAAVDAAKASLEEMNHHHPQNQQEQDATHNTHGRWRLLGQAAHGESHEIELEHGYRFQVHKLYA
jgi:hypothetical protein